MRSLLAAALALLVLSAAPRTAQASGGLVESVGSERQPASPSRGLGMTFVDVGQRSAPGLGVLGRFRFRRSRIAPMFSCAAARIAPN